MTEAKKALDVEALERDYRTGNFTHRQLGEKYGVSHAAVQKWVNKLGWTRTEQKRVPLREGAQVVKVADMDEYASAGFVYVIGIDAKPYRYFKIGMASCLPARMKEHQCSSPFDLYVACAYFVPNMRAEERSLHEQFAGQRIRGEWFALSDADLKEIASRSLLLEEVA